MLESSCKTWSKQLIGAKNMMAFISSKKVPMPLMNDDTSLIEGKESNIPLYGVIERQKRKMVSEAVLTRDL